jgi:hypothetical protein
MSIIVADRDHAARTATRAAAAAAAALALAAAPAALGQCTEGCTAIHTLTGEAAGDQFGWVSNHLDDVDGDGVRDFILTAPTNDAGGGNAGRVYVYSGATGDELWRKTGATGWQLGHDAGLAGFIDDDDVPDVIVGAPFVGPGRAFIYSGVDGSFIWGWIGDTVNDQFGYRVWGGGDFDGDGHDDVIVGARMHDTAGVNAGRAYVFNDAATTEIYTIDGPTSSDLLGSGVAFVGDVNHDGRDDVVVGAQNAGPTGGGLAYVYSWNGAACEQLYVLDPGSPSSNFGLWFMNGDHDVNGDGTPDVYVNDYAINRAHIFSGVDGAIIWTLSGDGTGQFGIGRIVDDIDGDCHADMLLAAWISPAGAASAGKAFVYSGRDGSVMDTYTHDVAGAGFGFDANGMGDVDGDGMFDHLITAASDLSSQGRAYVIAGEIAPPRAGDLDDDGDTDFQDLLQLLGTWGPCDDPPAPCPGDSDCDREIGFADLLAILANWS